MRSAALCAIVVCAGFVTATAASNSILSLSHYDEGAPDYAGLRKEGIEAIIHEATYPTEADARYAGRQVNAARAGMRWGAYHFGNATDGKRQADRFIDVVGLSANRVQGSDGKVLLILDAEQNTHYPGGTMRVQQAVDFIKRVKERTGVYPGFYSNENWVKSLFNSSSVDASSKETIKNCFLWVANYHKAPSSTAPWSNWMLWQYTGDGICGLPRNGYPIHAGNLRKVERTIFGGSREALRSFWDSHSWSPK